MCNLLLHHSARGVEMDTQKGDPLEYHYSMSVFSEVIILESCAMDVIHQYRKITMQKHVNREERSRSVSSLIQQVYIWISTKEEAT